MTDALWYPFSPPGATPDFAIVRGEGSFVYDSNGRAYLNATSGLWNLSLGFNHPEVLGRIEMQQRSLVYSQLFDATHGPAEALAHKLVKLSDGKMHHVYLSLSGSTAVEVAIRIARLHHRTNGAPERQIILSFDRSYHGCSMLGLSAGGLEREELARWEEPLPHFKFIPSPHCANCPLGLKPADCQLACLETLAQLLDQIGHQVAAVLVEPVPGSGGILVPPPDYFPRLTALCRDHGVLMIADEVATAGGRCGAMFASPLVGLDPDIIALSKGINAGYYPLGATLCSAGVVHPIRSAGAPLLYGSTQDGNPVACAAAIAALEVIEERSLFERARSLGALLLSELRGLRDAAPVVGEVRGLGLMLGIELAHQHPAPERFSVNEAAQVRHLCRQEGLLVYHFDSGLSLFPALTMTEAECGDMVDILRTVLAQII